jgi:hypothetical protein
MPKTPVDPYDITELNFIGNLKLKDPTFDAKEALEVGWEAYKKKRK